MRLLGVTLMVLFIAPAIASAQVQRPRGEVRQALEAQIFDRFVQRVGDDMGLDAPGRERLREYLRQSGGRRRALAQRTVALRRELQQAMYKADTPDATFRRIMNDLRELRREEQKLWEADHETLSRTLTPRQHAIFTLEWIRFQDRIRELAAQRAGGPVRRDR